MSVGALVAVVIELCRAPSYPWAGYGVFYNAGSLFGSAVAGAFLVGLITRFIFRRPS